MQLLDIDYERILADFGPDGHLRIQKVLNEHLPARIDVSVATNWKCRGKLPDQVIACLLLLDQRGTVDFDLDKYVKGMTS